MCFAHDPRSVKKPVHSSTISMPCAPCGRFAGSRSAVTAMRLPLMTRSLPLTSTVPENAPCTLSRLNSSALALALARSLIETSSSPQSGRSRMARATLRPMRPNPLIATLVAIVELLPSCPLSPSPLRGARQRSNPERHAAPPRIAVRPARADEELTKAAPERAAGSSRRSGRSGRRACRSVPKPRSCRCR